MCDSQKPLLTGFPPSYRLDGSIDRQFIASSNIKHFDQHKILYPNSRSMLLENAPSRPFLSNFISGCFMFGSADITKEVPSDPHIYFAPEEIGLSIRLWTHGWDFFNPHVRILYHNFDRSTRGVIWNDDKGYIKSEEVSRKRIHFLCGTSDTTDPVVLQEIDKYGLGSARSREEFEEFMGVDFKTQTIYKYIPEGDTLG